ncbi:MAG: TetR/AcrR family transcriptional regulator [Eubacteriaceae bacterium]|nr:TetR/AcrR family transcriptional regulator [Eubacteriaceae bacterium]
MSIETFEKLPDEKKELIVSTGIREFSSRSYREVSTDELTRSCGISKGILFHYFGSKKNFYLYCLECALKRLVTEKEPVTCEGGEDFYGIIFTEMERKISLCLDHPDESLMVNMASRDPSEEISEGRSEVMKKYSGQIREESLMCVERALSSLELKEPQKKRFISEGLFMYINAVVNRFLSLYQHEPEKFFAEAERIKNEIRDYLDLMLFGLCERGENK